MTPTVVLESVEGKLVLRIEAEYTTDIRHMLDSELADIVLSHAGHVTGPMRVGNKCVAIVEGLSAMVAVNLLHDLTKEGESLYAKRG